MALFGLLIEEVFHGLFYLAPFAMNRSFLLPSFCQAFVRRARTLNNVHPFPMTTSSMTLRYTATVKLRFFEEAMNNLVEVDAQVGKRVLDVALENNIDIEGACGGELACSTCHVILDQALYDKLGPKKEEEQDMLDLAWGVSDT
jgi:ferredoxin